MTFRRRVVGAVALCCALGCGGESPMDPGPPPPPGMRWPVPGCEAFDFGACDVLGDACQTNLRGIAQCLRGGAEQSGLAVPIATSAVLVAPLF